MKKMSKFRKWLIRKLGGCLPTDPLNIITYPSEVVTVEAVVVVREDELAHISRERIEAQLRLKIAQSIPIEIEEVNMPEVLSRKFYTVAHIAQKRQ